MDPRRFQHDLNVASARAADELAGLHAGEPDHDTATCIVENIIEAAAARVFLDLEREGRRRSRLEAVAVLRPIGLCGECSDLLAPPEEEAPAEEEHDQEEADAEAAGLRPGAEEARERALFLGWAGQVRELPGPELEASGQETSRMTLIRNIHTSVGRRHPLGIAESLSSTIAALHIAEDQEAIGLLEDLAAAELEAEAREKGEAALGALLTLVDPELEQEEARGIIADWTLAELGQVLGWAELRYSAAVSDAVTPPTPEVVAALARDLDLGEWGGQG